MKTNNGTKKNIVRLVAMLLVVVGVLAALPASAFAAWKYQNIIRSGSQSENFTGTQGDITVNYKFFGENMYYDAEGETTYYNFDSTASSTHYIAANDKGVSDLDDLTLTDIPFKTETVDSTTKKTFLNDVVGTTYCAGHILSSCSEYVEEAQVSYFNEKFPIVASLPYTMISGSPIPDYTYSISFTMKNGDGEDAHTGNLPSKTLDPHEGIVFSQTVDGKTTEIKVVTVFNVTRATISVDVSTKRGSHGLFNSHYTCTGTPTVVLEGTYQSYVVKEIGVPARTEKIGAVEDGAVLYAVGGYKSGDIIAAPSFPILKDALPASVQGRTMSVIGYYPEATADTTKAYKMPLKIGGNDDNSITPSEKTVVVNEKEVTQKYVDIWVKLVTTNPQTGNSQTNLNEFIGSDGQTILTGSSISSDFAYIPDYYEDSKGNTSGAIALTSPTVAGALDLAIAVNGSTATNVNADNGGTPGTANIASSNVSGSKTVPVEDNVRDFTIVLQQDTTIQAKATMTIGGYTGSISNGDGTPQGLIIGNYVALDLNGYTLTVANNGTLHSYGYIYDSVGTGKIVVEAGGTFNTQMVVLGWHGGTSSFEAYESGFCPFEDYFFPYVRATVEVEASSTDHGKLVGFTMIYAAGEQLGMYPISGLYMPVFGPSEDNPMFSASLRTGSAGKISMTTTLLSKDSFSQSYTDIHNHGVDIKNAISFENVNVKFAPPMSTVSGPLNAQISMDFRRTRFPLSPMLDTSFYNSTVTINQQIMVMPGCTFTVDKDSVLRLGYAEPITKLVGGWYVLGTIEEVNKRLSGGIFALPHPCYGAQNVNSSKTGLAFNGGSKYAGYWDVFGMASVNIYGTIEFQSGNYEEYVLSGNINVSSFRVDSGDSLAWTLDNLTEQNLENVALRTYGSITALGNNDDGIKVYHYYTSPMVNNGVAYILDSAVKISNNTPSYSYTGAMCGTYDLECGQFTKYKAIGVYKDDGYTKYIIDAKPYTFNGSSSNNALPNSGVTLEFQPIVLGITSELNTELVTASNGTTYVYYVGTYQPTTSVSTTKNPNDTCVISGAYLKTNATATTLTCSDDQWNAT